MRVIFLHSIPEMKGGAETIYQSHIQAFRQNNHNIIEISRNVACIKTNIKKQIQTFFMNVYPVKSIRVLAKKIIDLKPDILNVYNIFPMFSAQLLPLCRKAGIPIIMSLHNFQMTCPISIHIQDESICTRCKDGQFSWCALKNCRQNIPQSVGYTLRSHIVSKSNLFTNNVSYFVVPNQFVKDWLIDAGYNKNQIEIVNNIADLPEITNTTKKTVSYVAYAGRFTPEKGIDLLLDAAKQNPEIPFKLAGDYSSMPYIQNNLPQNVELVGLLERDQIIDFYAGARIFVLPTKWLELFPISILEAMNYSIPVITTRIAALPNIVDDGETGMLFEFGNAEDLSKKIRHLWNNVKLCKVMGINAKKKIKEKYNKSKFVSGYESVYKKAIALSQKEG